MSQKVLHKRKFFDFFPPPKFLEMPSVGIDISDQAIRFVELIRSEYSHQKYHVVSFGEKKIPEGVITSGFINKPEVIKKLLEEIRKEHSYHFVSAAIPEEKAYLFKTEVPKIEERQIRNNIEFRLEENVPVGPSDSVFDYDIMHRSTHAQDHIDVVVTVVPNKVIAAYTDLFEEANLVPISFELVTQAIAHSVVPRDDLETCLIVNVTDSRTGFGIVSEGAIQFTSTLNFGGTNFTSAIQKNYAVSLADAEKIKTEKGSVQNKGGKELLYSVSTTLSVLKDEIKKVITYWQDHIEKAKLDNPIKRVILCGKDAAMLGFEDYLSDSLSHPVSLANVWTNVFDFDQHIPEISFENSLNYAPAIGLALSRYTHA